MKNQLHHGDCVEGMLRMVDASVDLVFCDPPYNVGFDYGEEFNDSLSPTAYLSSSRAWIEQAVRVLKPNGALWLMIGDEWVADLTIVCREAGLHLRSHVIWHYTFSVNCTNKFNRSHVHLLYCTKHRKKFTFNADQIRVPSARALLYSDKRANPEGRLADDTWILRPQDRPESFPADSDTWYISRICGTFKERESGAANQLPEQLLGRIIRGCSNEGDLVLDPMVGTGTTLAVARKLGRQYVGFEQSKLFFDRATKRIRGCCPGDPLDGPVPQGG